MLSLGHVLHTTKMAVSIPLSALRGTPLVTFRMIGSPISLQIFSKDFGEISNSDGIIRMICATVRQLSIRIELLNSHS